LPLALAPMFGKGGGGAKGYGGGKGNAAGGKGYGGYSRGKGYGGDGGKGAKGGGPPRVTTWKRQKADDKDALPVLKHRREVLDALGVHGVVIVAGDTGCGKSTQVPQFLLDADPSARIVVTQVARTPSRTPTHTRTHTRQHLHKPTPTVCPCLASRGASRRARSRSA
jgi:hypothetical protein